MDYQTNRLLDYWANGLRLRVGLGVWYSPLDQCIIECNPRTSRCHKTETENCERQFITNTCFICNVILCLFIYKVGQKSDPNYFRKNFMQLHVIQLLISYNIYVPKITNIGWQVIAITIGQTFLANPVVPDPQWQSYFVVTGLIWAIPSRSFLPAFFTRLVKKNS